MINEGNPESSRIDIEVADTDQSRRGMVLPFTPLSITFDTIRYSVDIPPVISFKQLHSISDNSHSFAIFLIIYFKYV